MESLTIGKLIAAPIIFLIGHNCLLQNIKHQLQPI